MEHQHHNVSAFDWDERYAEADQMWSGEPNGVLVAEVAGLDPGRALDVGCGEGADALWLEARGWAVTALDVSRVALDRAAEHASEQGVSTVRWLHTGLLEAALPPGTFDLVSAQYFALPRTAGHASERALLDAVAVGGVLLAVHHPAPTPEEAERHGFSADQYIHVSDILEQLDDRWEVATFESRPRHLLTGAGAGHTEDIVLRATRLR